MDGLLDDVGVFGVESDVTPLLLDAGLDQIEGDRPLVAVGQTAVVAEAEEVHVLGAVAVLGLGDAQATAALAAVDAALEIVVVDAALFTGFVVGAEDMLDAIEGVLVDELGVGTGNFHRYQLLLISPQGPPTPYLIQALARSST